MYLARQPEPTTCAAAGRHRHPRPSEVYARYIRGQSPGGDISRGAIARTRSPSARRAAASPTAPRGPQRAEARDRLPHHGPQAAAQASPAWARSVTSTRTVPSPEMTATVTVSRGAPDRLCRILLLKISLLTDQQHGCVCARVPGAEYLRDERAGGPRPLCPPGKRHALPDRHPGHHRTALPRPPRPGKPTGQRACTLSSAANVKPAQRAFADPCPCLVRGRGPRPWPSVQSRRSRAPLPGPDSRPLCVRGHRNAAVYSVTR
jgi:hypothetical protein